MRRSSDQAWRAGLVAAGLMLGAGVAHGQSRVPAPDRAPARGGPTGDDIQVDSRPDRVPRGVVPPPMQLDPGIQAPVPAPRPGTAPVIPPPGTPGGDPGLDPR